MFVLLMKPIYQWQEDDGYEIFELFHDGDSIAVLVRDNEASQETTFADRVSQK